MGATEVLMLHDLSICRDDEQPVHKLADLGSERPVFTLELQLLKVRKDELLHMTSKSEVFVLDCRKSEQTWLYAD